jgi:hypothetical protein
MEANNITGKYKEALGDNELFETDHIDRVFVDTINGKCQVIIHN